MCSTYHRENEGGKRVSTPLPMYPSENLGFEEIGGRGGREGRGAVVGVCEGDGGVPGAWRLGIEEDWAGEPWCGGAWGWGCREVGWRSIHVTLYAARTRESSASPLATCEK